MKWLVPIVCLLAAPPALGASQVPLLGKVVAVPDCDSVWVYLDAAQASYHFGLSGVPDGAALEASCGLLARDMLSQMVLGRDVVIVAPTPLSDLGEIPAQVWVDGQLVNVQIARLAPQGSLRTWPPETQPRRPLLTLCRAIRQLFVSRGP